VGTTTEGLKPAPRRDYRSSIDGIRYSQSTEEITYTWKNLNVWTPGSTAMDPEAGGTGCCKKKSRRSKHLLKDGEEIEGSPFQCVP